MSPIMNAAELYKAGKLQPAIDAAVEDVRKQPTNPAPRGLLAEFLCFAGEWERADKQLDALGHQDPAVAVGIALFRHLIRAAQARQDFYTSGRVPDFLGQPSQLLRLHLQASICMREGKAQEATELLAQAEQQRPHVPGACNGQPFADFRDLDDLTSCIFEVLTSTGKYFWIPLDRVESVEFRAPARPRDLLWRQAHMIVRDGPDGEVYLPTIYAAAQPEADDSLRLGRATDWREGPPVRGVGQRTFLVGDSAVSILELQTIQFTAPAAPPTPPPPPADKPSA
jgi:type VI secretion system protein ImpE